MLINGHILGQGNTAQVVLLDENRVAKVFHEHIHSSYINQELTNSQKIIETGLCVPKVYGERIVQGKKAIIYENIKGFPLTQKLEEKPWTVIRQIKIMAKLQADIHQKSGLTLPFQKKSFEWKIEKVTELTSREKKTIIDYLHMLPEDNILCHGDFHPNNILLSDKGPIIIDWSDATIGNHMADLVRTILIINYGGFPKEISPFHYRIHRIFRRLMTYYYLRYYKKFLPYTTKTFKQWELPVAAARLAEDLSVDEKKKLLSLVRFHLENI